MGIKIGITGHTRAFGRVIRYKLDPVIEEKNAYAAEKTTWCGFSRSNGYDITNLDQVESIFDDEPDLAVIINNAEAGEGQLNVAEAAYRHRIPCINIGSKITEVPMEEDEWSAEDIAKKDVKTRLKNFSSAHRQEYVTFGFLAPSQYIDANPEVEEKNMDEYVAAQIVINKLNDMGII